MSSDSVVALAPATRAGRVLFAKNSDRPAGECQPLLQAAPADHRPGERLRCQYVEIEQVPHTHGFVGSRPYWLWGVEHGVNEHGVAAGNHTIFTRDPVADSGLTGMDLVRLGLERAASAHTCRDVIINLIERYGQGGSGFAHTHWPYHNAFLVADGDEAYLLEASGRNWAWRHIRDVGSATNHVTITTDWDALSDDCERHARAQGWWSGGGRFDFAAAYRDSSLVPDIVSSARYATTCSTLVGASGDLDRTALKRLMRDHNDGSEVYRPGRTPDDPRYYSVCMHADPVGTTTASVVVELGPVASAARPLWVAFCNPCIAPYLPVFREGRIPPALLQGDAEPSQDSAWWRFKQLLACVEADWTKNAAHVREYWSVFEEEIESSLAHLLEVATECSVEERSVLLSRYMDDLWRQTDERLDRLLAALS